MPASKEDLEAFMNTVDAIVAIAEQVKAKALKTTGGSGEVDCPKCKTGKIKFKLSGPKKHLHAICTTPKCFSIME